MLTGEPKQKEGTDGVHGDLCYMDGDRIVRKWHQGQGVIRSGWMPGHPTLYLKKEVYDRFGLYRTDYRISGDYEFMVRILYRKEVTLSYLPEILIYMSHGGTSTNSLGAYVESMMEGHRALVENHVPLAWVTDLSLSPRSPDRSGWKNTGCPLSAIRKTGILLSQ